MSMANEAGMDPQAIQAKMAGMAQDLTSHGQNLMSGMNELSSEWMNFCQRRMHAYMEQMRALSEVRDVSTLMDLNTRFAREMASEYADEAKKLMEIGQNKLMPKNSPSL